MAQRIVTAAFDTRDAADRAVQQLESMGISRSSIRVLPENSATSLSMESPGAVSSHYDTSRDEKGFWASLGDLFMPDEDRHSYSEAMHRGHYVVSATVDESQADNVEDTLDRYGTNLAEHESKWRAEGWAGYQARSSTSRGTMGETTGLTGASATARAATDKQAIPVVEERLNVGKRVENSGRVRVRSYVVETPVQEQVNLRDERVNVERRPVDRPLTAGDAAFKERTIEATEHVERPVVQKEARVTEEVVLNKDIQSRTETVKDTVRKTQVDVEDERTDRKRGTTK